MTVRLALTWLTTALVCVVAVAAVRELVPAADYPPIDPSTVDSQFVAVTTRISDRPAQAELAISWTQGTVLRSSSTGLVTDLTAEAAISCGSVVLHIDGEPVVATCGSAPLWRDVGGWTTGSDRDEVVELLEAEDLLSNTNPGAREVSRAIAQFQEERGLTRTGLLLAESTVWIGSGDIATAEPLVEIGDRVALDDPIYQIAPTLTEAIVESSDFDTTGPIVFSISESPTRFAISDGRVTDLQSLEIELRQLDPLPDAELATRVAGSIRLAEPRELLAVPATAVITDNSVTCVMASRGADLQPVEVSVLGSLTGTVLVDAELADGDLVLVNPTRTEPCS